MEHHKPKGQELHTTKESKTENPEVQIGQVFQLFPKDNTHITEITRRYRIQEYTSDTRLVAPTKERVSFSATLVQNVIPTDAIVTPFNPEKGYSIDEFDFDEYTSNYKFERWKKHANPDQIDPLKLGLNSPLSRVDDISDNTYDSLQDLRIQIIANGLVCQANQSHIDEDAKIDFDYFYPLDSGPLPYLPGNGFHIHLPDDFEKIQTVRARFVLPKR